MDAVEIFKNYQLKETNETLNLLHSIADSSIKKPGFFKRAGQVAGSLVGGNLFHIVLSVALPTLLDMAMNMMLNKAAQDQQNGQKQQGPRQLTDSEVSSLVADYVKRLPPDERAVVLGQKEKLKAEVRAKSKAEFQKRHGRKFSEANPFDELQELQDQYKKLQSELGSHRKSGNKAEADKTKEKMQKLIDYLKKFNQDDQKWVKGHKNNRNVIPAALQNQINHIAAHTPSTNPVPTVPLHTTPTPKTISGHPHANDGSDYYDPIARRKATEEAYEKFLHPNKFKNTSSLPVVSAKPRFNISLPSPTKKNLAIGGAVAVTGAMLIYAAHKFLAWLRSSGKTASKMSDSELMADIDQNLEEYHIPSVVVRARIDHKFRKKLVEDTFQAVRKADELGGKNLVLASKGILKHPNENGPYSPVEEKGIVRKAGEWAIGQAKTAAHAVGEWTGQAAKFGANNVATYGRDSVIAFGRAAVAVAVATLAGHAAEKIFTGEGKWGKIGREVIEKGTAMTAFGGGSLVMGANVAAALEEDFKIYANSLIASSDPNKKLEGEALRKVWDDANANEEIRKLFLKNLRQNLQAHRAGIAMTNKDWFRKRSG